MLAPLPALGYPMGSAAEALRQLAAAQHIGKVVVEAPAAAPCKLPGRWLVLGGLGALGLLSARWLASQGETRPEILPMAVVQLLYVWIVHITSIADQGDPVAGAGRPC